jgi:hypothetical protein
MPQVDACLLGARYVLSTTLTSALWLNTRFVRNLEEVAALKQQRGKDIY